MHMKKVIIRSLLVAAISGSLLLLGGGCAKKSVIPPSTVGSNSSTTAQGKNITYPPAEGSYSENNLPVEGSLSDTPSSNVQHLGSMALDTTQAEATPEYKKEHGRSSPGLYPIYFDFDQAGVRPDMSQRMTQNADYLKNVNSNVVIEGNCDDRGTKEYNLALAERRAINARQYLINLGISGTRIRTVSYGEERPLFLEENEFAWSQNRRADFVIE